MSAQALYIQATLDNSRLNLDEERLMDLCKSQDPSGQSALYDKYVNKMTRLCMRYIPEYMEAEDAMINGFVKVFNKIDQFEYRGKGSLEGWIKRIMVNECLMLLRKKKYEKVELSAVSNVISIHHAPDSKLLEERILKVVSELPNGYRTVFNMYVIEGYNHKEIGEKLGISENTSKSQLSKAKNSLRETLTKIGAL